MKYIVNIIGTIIIAISVIIACIGSYKAHRQSMQLRELPPEVVVELDSDVEVIEQLPTAVKTVTCQKDGKTFDMLVPTFEPADIPMLKNNQFVNLTYEERDHLLDVAMAEAEGEDSVGKALVMITVLNRTEYFGATIPEIIYAPNQFAVSRMGIQPSEDCYEALGMVVDGWDETWIEGDWDHSMKILWFGADGYPAYGEPMFQYGGHYFSGLKEE